MLTENWKITCPFLGPSSLCYLPSPPDVGQLVGQDPPKLLGLCFRKDGGGNQDPDAAPGPPHHG